MMERRAAMNERASEEHLIEACRQGDREAFRQMFELYQDRVWSIALHFSGDEAAARDITQQVFLKLFKTIGQFRGESGFGSWLYRLVANACLDDLRRRRRFVSFDFWRAGEEKADGAAQVDLSELGTVQAIERFSERLSLEDQYRQVEISAAVKAAVKELKPKLRMAILLKYFEGLSYEEMAQALGCSMGTVASRLNRGHKELARRLAYLREAAGDVQPSKND